MRIAWHTKRILTVICITNETLIATVVTVAGKINLVVKSDYNVY